MSVFNEFLERFDSNHNDSSYWKKEGLRDDILKFKDEFKGEIIKNFLIEIKSDIEQIDCGCSDCISGFLSGVNPVIEKYGLELKLNGESSVCYLGLDLIDKTENHP